MMTELVKDDVKTRAALMLYLVDCAKIHLRNLQAENSRIRRLSAIDIGDVLMKYWKVVVDSKSQKYYVYDPQDDVYTNNYDFLKSLVISINTDSQQDDVLKLTKKVHNYLMSDSYVRTNHCDDLNNHESQIVYMVGKMKSNRT